jgi:hypothetical protein
MKAADTKMLGWLFAFRQKNAALLNEHPEFAKWLDEEYLPLAGGWQY